MKPLAKRNEQCILGIQGHNKNFKLTLFADDLLLSISNPSSALPALESILEELSLVSGLKINQAKSKWFLINLNHQIKRSIKKTFSLGFYLVAIFWY